MKNFLLILVLIVSAVWFGFFRDNKEAVVVNSFETCVEAGNPVMESFPRQCKTPDGLTYAEEITPSITYNNASDDLIKVELPFPGAVTGKEFAVTGQARGYWFFEATFPVDVLDKDGNILVQTYASAQADPKTGEVNWMTEDFVPFKAEVVAPQSYIGEATLVLHRNNASGLPEHDASLSFPFTIEY